MNLCACITMQKQNCHYFLSNHLTVIIQNNMHPMSIIPNKGKTTYRHKDYICIQHFLRPFLHSPPFCAPPTQPSRARSWQPLHTPRLSVSLRCRKRSNSSRALGLKVTVAAQPERTIRTVQHKYYGHKISRLFVRKHLHCLWKRMCIFFAHLIKYMFTSAGTR